MSTAAQDYLRRTFGGDCEFKEVTVATGANPVPIAGGNPDAVEVVYVNLGTNSVFIGTDASVSASKGILLVANGGFVSMDIINDAILPTLNWQAVSPAGASTLYALLVIRSIAAPTTT